MAILLVFNVISPVLTLGVDEIESNNRYYYITERGPTKYNVRYYNDSQARNHDLAAGVASPLLGFLKPYGSVLSIIYYVSNDL